jgi:hypothetical protein
MTESETFKETIQKISPEQWSELFDLILEIEQSTIFGEPKGLEKIVENLYTMPYIQSEEIVDKFVSISYKLGIISIPAMISQMFSSDNKPELIFFSII